MKFMVVGGSGVMGSAASYDLVKLPEVEKVVIVSRSAKKENLKSRLAQSEKVEVKNLDISDKEAMIKEMKNYDVIINCVGPFYSTGYKVARLAIEAGINYVDIADDYDAVYNMQDEQLDKDAKAAGITVLYSMGSDPGTANILAKSAADKMDRVDEVEFHWFLGAVECTGPAVWEHIIHMNTGLVPQFIDGKLQDVPAGTGSEVIEFLEPYGKVEVHYVGHPEPLTFPKYYKDVKKVINKGGMLPKWVNEAIKVQNKWGFTSPDPIEVEGTKIKPREMALALWHQRPPKEDLGDYRSGIKVIVRGLKDGKNITHTFDMIGNTAPGTGIPAAITAYMMARGDVKEKGVLPPEGCIDPEIYVDLFLKRKATIVEKVEVDKVIKE